MVHLYSVACHYFFPRIFMEYFIELKKEKGQIWLDSWEFEHFFFLFEGSISSVLFIKKNEKKTEKEIGLDLNPSVENNRI